MGPRCSPRRTASCSSSLRRQVAERRSEAARGVSGGRQTQSGSERPALGHGHEGRGEHQAVRRPLRRLSRRPGSQVQGARNRGRRPRKKRHPIQNGLGQFRSATSFTTRSSSPRTARACGPSATPKSTTRSTSSAGVHARGRRPQLRLQRLALPRELAVAGVPATRDTGGAVDT